VSEDSKIIICVCVCDRPSQSASLQTSSFFNLFLKGTLKCNPGLISRNHISPTIDFQSIFIKKRNQIGQIDDDEITTLVLQFFLIQNLWLAIQTSHPFNQDSNAL
jgi:hypothetical protein